MTTRTATEWLEAHRGAEIARIDGIDWLYIGNCRSCKEMNPGGATIHIARSDQDMEKHLYRFCETWRSGKSDAMNFIVDYRDNDPIQIEVLRELKTRIDGWVSAGVDVLVHCAAGHCRAPTFAVACLVASGADVFDALWLVYRNQWKHRHLVCNIGSKPIASIIDWSNEMDNAT